jgi:metal-responsive CopG/Arc/MetJ family transcriptional regulator
MQDIRTRSRLRDTTQAGDPMPIRHIRIDDETWATLDDIARRADTTRAELIRWAIDRYLLRRAPH